MKCTSGRRIEELAQHPFSPMKDEPCGEILTILGNALVCPKCDSWPSLRSE